MIPWNKILQFYGTFHISFRRCHINALQVLKSFRSVVDVACQEKQWLLLQVLTNISVIMTKSSVLVMLSEGKMLDKALVITLLELSLGNKSADVVHFVKHPAIS